MALEIKQKEMHGIIILAPVGRWVLGQESMDFRAKVKEVLDTNDWYKKQWGWGIRLVLDCGELSFVDSAGLGALIQARTSAMHRGAEMKLANLTKKMRDILSIAKLATVFDVYENVEAAVSSYAAAETATETAQA